ncbi:PREDICTED: G-type lectin S-receptor-like serine/threonine-protein kinase LECRK1 [Nelumbo nucifera]|uniref:Receptor-like serine/threonine-protein kinase n=2 Tax=Nelumbo nucifera TaxID=4432 RepID=A0A1U8PYZ2_NELNU|nr:PREDICTED: G-type lectin S-receptor-like serine/threonine-protein kinase LECRK1 [Nelumbo nucifera]DAD22587.1 TPA_asm: hypothetical protein HUJ06_024050 [Nelumbo nucifera]
MAAVLFFLLISVFSSLAGAQQRSSHNISLGSSLSTTNTSSWLSPSGRFAFGFYSYGNGFAFAVGIWFAEIHQKTVVWTANRQDPPVPGNTTLRLTTDGALILQSAQGQTIKSITNSNQSVSYASLLDSGNFVLCNSRGEVIWQSFNYPTDTLLPGQRLPAGADIISSVSQTDHSNGSFRLLMQLDGYLVQYPVDAPFTEPYAYWASGPESAQQHVSLNFDSDGHLCLLSSTSVNIKNVTNGGFATGKTMVYRMTIDADGILRLYTTSLDRNSSDWSIVWNSTNDYCVPKGLCGINAYCILVDSKADCQCLPGYDFINKNQQTWGCARNFSAESCGTQNQNIEYNMLPLDHTTWVDEPYTTLWSITTEEDCRNACLKDCSCEAVTFNQQCKKQMLPLRYGRSSVNGDQSTMVYVKAGSRSKINGTSTRNKDILIIIGVVPLAFIVLVFSVVFSYRNRVGAYKRILEQRNIELTEEIALRSFTFAEIQKITQGFKEEVGKGGFGTVFKGTLPDGDNQKMVAVKRLHNMLDGEKEFRTEMRVIAKTHHRNLVRLVGYCYDGSNMLLVYEYMSNGSLANLLFTEERQLHWHDRVGIALSIARGLRYLHDECESQIIHCDIKPENKLMDELDCPKIADFGVSKLLKPDQIHTFTGLRGTTGYLAPEWLGNNPITVKADVFSFGVVLLELVCRCRRVDHNAPEDEIDLKYWVNDC